MEHIITETREYSTALDNHEPVPRETAKLVVSIYGDHPSWRIERALSTLKDANKAIYLLDDGETIQAFYVVGWHRDHDYVLIQPMPTNPGRAMKRPDGRTVDYSLWSLGPRRSYHLKLVNRNAL